MSYSISTSQNEELHFQLITGEDGKPLGKITAMSQDPDGYMWFCGQGEKCLYRYDGYRLISYKQDIAETNSMSSTSLETIYADDRGKIWIGYADGGLDEFNPKNGVFNHYRHSPNDTTSLCNNEVNVIFKDSRGRLWIGTANGLDCFEEKSKKFIHYRNEPGNPNSLSNNLISTIYEDRQGGLWIGTGRPWDGRGPEEGGLNRMELNGTFQQYKHNAQDPNSLINNKVRAIYEDSRGTFWVGTAGDGLHTMDRKTGQFVRHTYNPNHINRLSRPPKKSDPFRNHTDHITFITEDISGSLWIGSMWSGLTRYDALSNKITRFEASNGFPDSSSWNVFQSNNGVLWITTQEDHLYRLDPSHKPISSTPTSDQVFAFLDDQAGNFWVGTLDGGLIQFDQNGKKINQYKHDNSDAFSLFDDHNRVLAIFQNQKDTLWVGTSDGVGTYSTNTRKFSRLPIDVTFNRELASRNPYADIIQDYKGLKWFATLGAGLIQFNSSDLTYKQYLSNQKRIESISSDIISSVIEDNSGNIWASGKGGIDRLDRNTDHFSHYLKGLFVKELFEDSKGRIWAGTIKGIYRYDDKIDQFLSFVDPNSLVNTLDIIGMEEDYSGYIWCHSPSHLIKLNPSDSSTFIYDSKFGIRYNSLQIGASYVNAKGQIFVGFDRGFYSFLPEDLIRQTDSKIFITDLFVNTTPVLVGKKSLIQKPLEEVTNLTLSYNQNNVSFNFASDDYRAGAKFFTTLENYENTWREAKNEKSSYYFNIPPGSYTYRIKFFNADGVKAEKSIHILINPPWWKRWWAYTLYGLILTAILFLVYWEQKQRITRLERQKALTKEIEQSKEIEKAYHELKVMQDQLIQSEKMASLGELTSGIAHEIKNPLNFINNFSEINMELLTELEEEQIPDLQESEQNKMKPLLKNLKKNSEKINLHGKRVDSIVRGMLQHSRQGGGVKQLINIFTLCDESLKLAYHGFKSKEKAFTAFYETQLLLEDPMITCVPQDIGRAILNIVNNAFYAVNQKKIKLQSEWSSELHDMESEYNPSVVITLKNTTHTPKSVLITVSDNGQGIPEDIVNKVFQPFFTSKPTGEGTGLGLSMAYDIITKGHGGELKVKSTVGVGTDFEILLPYNT